MSADEHALLAAVAARPDDDLPRLVYADWLDEHGRHVRAEFIRLQCEVAALEADTDQIRADRHRHHWRRQDALIDAHAADLLGPLGGAVDPAAVQFRRGFAARVDLPVGDFLAVADRLAAAVPQPAVRVSQVAAEPTRFLACPHLGCVTELSAYAPGVGDDLPILMIDEAVRRMAAAAARLTRLEVLDLEGCELGDWFCDLLPEFRLPSLAELDLSNNVVTDAGVAALIGWADLPRRLILGGNPIHDQGAIELADRLGPTRVEYLNLRGCPVGRDGQVALLRTFDRQGKKVDLF